MSAETDRPQPRPGVTRIAPYVPGKSKAAGNTGKTYKLSSNETPLGASPKAIEAYHGVADALEMYPDGASTELRDTIARVHGLNPDRLICGNGSDEILSMISYAYIGPGDEGLYSEYGFVVYPLSILAAGGEPVAAPETDYKANVDTILSLVTERTKVVFLANPNNPTGTYLPIDEVRRLHAGLPKNVLFVLDAAYAEYVRRNDYEAGIELVSSSDNVVMTRTFSKIHGLASLRLGWAYGPDHVIDAMNRIRGPFNVTGPAMAAGIAAVQDREFVAAAAEHNDKWLPWLTEQLTGIGLEVTPSVGNFILIHFPDTVGKQAADADAELQRHGVVMRQVGNYGLPHALRMSVGTEEANRLAVEVLGRFMAGEA